MSQGKRVKARRLKKNLTQRQLADRLGVSESYISRLEAGERSLRAFEIGLRLCEELGLNPKDLVDAA